MQRELLYDSVFDSQAHYRRILDAMARPGEVRELHAPYLSPPDGICPAAALVGFALLNGDASFCAFDDDAVAGYLRENTDGVIAGVSDADFIFMRGETAEDASVVTLAREGTLSYPEGGATLVLSVDRLGEPDGAGLTLFLTGPGVALENRLFVKGLAREIIEEVRRKNAEFPLGVDLVLADKEGRIACIPRSSKIIVK